MITAINVAMIAEFIMFMRAVPCLFCCTQHMLALLLTEYATSMPEDNYGCNSRNTPICKEV